MPGKRTPTPDARLAKALAALKKLQDKQSGIVESGDLAEEHRALLVDVGFLRQVMKGWYFCTSPNDDPGDSTAWYGSFWAFVGVYLRKRFGNRYCLSPDASLRLHTGNTAVPSQVIVTAKEGGTLKLDLPFDTSLLIYRNDGSVAKGRTAVRGIQVLSVPDALCRAAPRYFQKSPLDGQVALSLVRDVSELLAVLLSEPGARAAAGRLAGALRFMGRETEADRLVATMRRAGTTVRERNPFEVEAPLLSLSRERSPYVMRLAAMWKQWRDDVIAVFPTPPGRPKDAGAYLAEVQERYSDDAYNSLSIEGYQVTDALIERVAARGWNPEGNSIDRKDRDALAARGYHQAFQAVKESLGKIIAGADPGVTVRVDHHAWHRELFGPAVTAGIVSAAQLAGYRNGPVFIRNSKHSPLPREAVLDAMDNFFELLIAEPHAGVRAVLGHHLFVFIHPYFDGNGRLGRFLMNAMMASGGYPWTVVRHKLRMEYMATLETASVAGDIRPFARFLAQEMAQRPGKTN
jgi:hypothetical protein